MSKIPHCWQKPEPCLSLDVTERSFKPVKGSGLGKLFSYQQPDPTWAYQKTVFYFYFDFFDENTISFKKNDYIKLFGKFSHITHLFAVFNQNTQLACVKYIASVHSEPESNSLS